MDAAIGRRVLIAGSLYALWVAGTWWFEGRTHALLRPEAIGDRLLYAIIVNLLLGIVGATLIARHWQSHAGWKTVRMPWARGQRVGWSVLAGLLLGGGSYLLQGAPSLDLVLVVNAFAQVLVVSAAEVLVCWALLGGAIEEALQRGFGRWAIVPSMAIASVAFGAYHFAHSPPFNAPSMVFLLVGVGLVTGLFFAVSRDVAGTIVFHNFLALFGVVKALVAADATAPLQQWQPQLLFSAVLVVAAIAAGYFMLTRGGAARGRRTSARLPSST